MSSDKTRRTDKLSLAPLGFEEALAALAETGPSPKEPADAEAREDDDAPASCAEDDK